MTAPLHFGRCVVMSTVIAYTFTACLFLRTTLSWRQTIPLLLLQISACAIAHFAIPPTSVLVNYSAHILAGFIAIGAGWTAVHGIVHAGFARGAFAALLLSAAAWLVLAHVAPARRAVVTIRCPLGCREQAVMFVIPIVIATMCGIMYAWTNVDSIRISERLADAVNGTLLGVVCGVVMTWPLLCLPQYYYENGIEERTDPHSADR